MVIQALKEAYTNQFNLTKQLKQNQADLEKNVELRTADLSRRLGQIRTAAAISRALSTMLDPQDLIQQVVERIQEEFDLYYVGIFLLDESKKKAVLRAGSGDAGKKMVANHHMLDVGGSSMVGWATANITPRIALDTGNEAIRFDNPYLPLTRSEIALPIASRGQVLGALSIQSSQPEAFDNNDILILQGIAELGRGRPGERAFIPGDP